MHVRQVIVMPIARILLLIIYFIVRRKKSFNKEYVAAANILTIAALKISPLVETVALATFPVQGVLLLLFFNLFSPPSSSELPSRFYFMAYVTFTGWNTRTSAISVAVLSKDTVRKGADLVTRLCLDDRPSALLSSAWSKHRTGLSS